MKRLKFLLEERARIEGEMSSIYAKCETENRSRNTEERTRFDSLEKELTDTNEEIRAAEKMQEIETRGAKPVVTATIKKDNNEVMTLRSQIEKWHEANKETIDAIRRGESRALPQMELRAPFTMTIAATNSGSSIFLPNAGGVQGSVNDLRRTRPTFWSRLTKGRTNLNPYTWVNKTNKQGTAQFIGEGVLKPLVSFELTTEQSNAKKVAERFRVSTELLNDIDGMQSLIENEARFEVEVAANTAVLTGTASSTSPGGVTTVSTAFTLTTIEAGASPTHVDAIRAAAAQLRSLNFSGDIVAFVNPIDAANIDLSKGTDGHYLIPPFASADGQTIGGISVIEDNNIAVGNLLIGDMTKYKVLMVQDFHVKWGYDSDDFSKNLITMIAEMRFHQFVGANDTGAFIYDSFTDIIGAITTT